MSLQKPDNFFAFPVIGIALFLVIVYALCTLWQLSIFKPVYPMHQFRQSMDLFDYYAAAQQLSKPDGSMYDIKRYVTPPTAALILYPLTKIISYSAARKLFQLLMLICIALSMFVSIRIFFPAGQHSPINSTSRMRILYICLAVITLYSYPVYFIFDRINADWSVLICVWIGLFLLSRQYNFAAGLSFGMGAAIKVYPLLLILPLIIHRKWKTLCTLFVPLTLFFLFRPGAWVDYLQFRLAERLDFFRVTENVSLANTLYYLAYFLHIPLSRPFLLNFASILFGITICGFGFGIFRNRKSTPCLLHIVYLMPCMFLIPSISYAYSLIFILPLIPFYISRCHTSLTPKLRRVYIILFWCVALTQIQAVLIEKLSGLQSIHFLPSLGLLGIVVCSLVCVYCSDKE